MVGPDGFVVVVLKTFVEAIREARKPVRSSTRFAEAFRPPWTDSCTPLARRTIVFYRDVDPCTSNHIDEWYVLFSLNGDQLALDKLDAAFKGSPFSIPRDNLRLFGEVVLEVEIDEARAPKLLTDLKTVRHFKVEETKRDKGTLLVTAVTLYPPHMGAETADFGKKPIEKELFGVERSDFAPKADPPATARDLPAYAGLRAVVEKNNGSLKGLRWKLLGCHVQGGVAIPDVAEKRK